MKSLEQLNNVEKARLLYDLFPREIAAFVEYAQYVCEYIQQDKEKVREKWDNPLRHPETWFRLVADTEARIKKYQSKLSASGRLFSDQLFDGYSATVSIHCLALYVTTQHLGNAKFSIAADLLFSTSDYAPNTQS